MVNKWAAACLNSRKTVDMAYHPGRLLGSTMEINPWGGWDLGEGNIGFDATPWQKQSASQQVKI